MNNKNVYSTKNDNNIFKKLRIKTNKSQTDIAKKFNVTQSAVSKWETGKALPDPSMLTQIAEYYNVSVESLLKNYEEKNEYLIKRPNYELSDKFLQDYAELLKDKSFMETTKLYNAITPELRALALGYIVGVLQNYNVDTKKILGYW